MLWESFESYDELSERAAFLFLTAVRSTPEIVLGLPTGRSPLGMYERVVRDCHRQYRCFRYATTFNLDEYAGIAPEDPGSYATYMRGHLFDHVDVDPARTNLPNGLAPDLDAECRRYEDEIRLAGGLELTFLGLGRNGHIGFNEPGTPFDSRTRVVELTESTRAANAPFFENGHVPEKAITIGIGTILDSREIILIASGSGKAEAVARLRSGVQEPAFPASALWRHGNVRVLHDVNR